MKIDTFKYFFSYAKKRLKGNTTITMASIASMSAIIFIFRLFLLYLMSIKHIINKKLIWIGTPIFVLIIGLLLFLIVTIIKMAVICRSREIIIMKSVGATNWFIRWTFIVEGLIVGIVGACAGNLLLFCIYKLLYTKVVMFTEAFNPIQSTFATNIMLWQFVLAGACIGCIGYIIALRKILKYGVWEN